MKILSLDTATHTGWAILDTRVSRGLHSGVVDLSIRTKPTKKHPADPAGKRFALFHDWLEEAMIGTAFDLLVYEKVVGGRHAGGNVSLIQKGLEAIAIMTAFRHGVPHFDLAAGTIKKWATGSGKLEGAEKLQMVTRAQEEFPSQSVADDNQADALWILDLAVATMAKYRVAVRDLHAIPPQDEVTKYATIAITEKWKR